MPGESTIAAGLSGRVTRKEDGAAVSGAVVSVAPRQPAGFISENENAVVVTTDSDGRWTAKSIPVGVYEVSATADGYKPASRSQVHVRAVLPRAT